MIHEKWTCLKCCEIVDPDYDVCWNCGTNREGFVDDAFVTADEAGPIYDPLVDRPPDAVPETLSELPEPLQQPVEVYASRDPVTAQHIVAELRHLGIPAIVAPVHNMYWRGDRVLVRAADEDFAREWVARFLAEITRRDRDS